MRHLLTLLLCWPLAAATLYVAPPPAGNDTTGNGSSGSPWATIGKAAASVNAGDTVNVAAGTYNEYVTLTRNGTSANRITWLGERDGDDWLTIIDPSVDVGLTGWTQATELGSRGTLVWKKSFSTFTPVAMTVDGKSLWMLNGKFWDTRRWPLTATTNMLYSSMSYINQPFWPGVGGMWAWTNNVLFIRFQMGESPATKTSIKVAHKGNTTFDNFASVDAAPIMLQADYNTIQDFKIQGGLNAIYIRGGVDSAIIRSNYLHATHDLIKGSFATKAVGDNNLIEWNTFTQLPYVEDSFGGWSHTKPDTFKQCMAYLFNKTWQSPQQFEGMGIHIGRHGQNNIIQNNVFTNISAGIAIGSEPTVTHPDSSTTYVVSNAVYNASASGIFWMQGIGDIVVVSNTVQNAHYFGRMQYLLNGSARAQTWLVYGNTLNNTNDVGSWVYHHAGTLQTTNNFPTLWMYHNSASGAEYGWNWGGGGADFNTFRFPSYRTVNNLISVSGNSLFGDSRFLNLSTAMGPMDYNVLYNKGAAGGSYVLANNVTPTGSEWDTSAFTDFEIDAGSVARAAGIDVSAAFTLVATEYAALDGFASGYYESDIGPDIGAWQYSPGATVPLVSVTATDPLAHESLLTTGTFTLTRTESLTGTLTVDYTISGTATAGTDYVDDLGTSITFADGVGSTNLAVTPLSNGSWKGNQTVVITLAEDAAYLLRQPTTATITIIEGDSQPGALTRPPAPGQSPATRRPML